MGSDRTPGGAQEALSCRRVSHNSWTVTLLDHGIADVVTGWRTDPGLRPRVERSVTHPRSRRSHRSHRRCRFQHPAVSLARGRVTPRPTGRGR
jgi:hypothetical protein